MVVHGPEPHLVLRVRVEPGEHHVVAAAGPPGPGVAGRVRDQGEVVPGGGAQVRRHRAQALQQEQVVVEKFGAYHPFYFLTLTL